MAALPQCDAYGLIYDPDGAPDVDKLVIVLKVIDAAGNPISFEQRQTFTDNTGTFHFTLPQNAKVTLTARASGIFADDAPVTFVVPAAPTGELMLSFPPDNLTVTPPLTWSADTLGILKATTTQDGYLAAADYVRFNAATNGGPKVTTFNSRSGDVLPVASDYQSFYLGLAGGTLTGPLTLQADPTTALGAATRQYVDAKFAAGVSGVATFNGRTGAVVPISGDYSSFYSASAHTHPVFTLSVPGMVPAPSTSSGRFLKDDGTWTAPAATGVAIPGIYLASDFNASGSANRYSGSIAAGTLTTLILTSGTHDFKVNQGIYIAGAAPASAPLVTKITAISGPTITLRDAASQAVTAVANNVQHDDSEAINAGMAAVVQAGGGELWFAPTGFYRVNGPFQWTQSILTPPYVACQTGKPVYLGLMAVAMPVATIPGTPNSAVIQTDKIGSSENSILAFAVFNNNPADMSSASNILLRIKGLIFQTYVNTRISGLDCGMITNLDLQDFIVETVSGNYQALVPPPYAGYFGIRLPRINNSEGTMTTRNIGVQNFDIGIIAAELWTSQYAAIGACNVGLKFIGGNFYCQGDAVLYHCPTSIQVDDTTMIDFLVNYEQDAGGVWAPLAGRDLYDPNNKCAGFLKHVASVTGTGAARQIQVTGFNDGTVIALRQFGTYTGAAVPMRFIGPTRTDGNFSARSTIDIYDGTTQRQISFNANDTAATGYRQMRIPNGTAADVTPPVISGVSVTTISASNATIVWTTDEASSSQVEYEPAGGSVPPYDYQTTFAPAMVTSHSVTVSGLTASTTYHYRVKSQDAAVPPNMAISSDFTFTTAASGGGTLNTGLVSYWKMEQAAAAIQADELGNNPLTPSGTLLQGSGKIAYGLYSANNGYLQCADNPSQNFTTTSLTVAGWIQVNSLLADNADYPCLIAKYPATGPLSFWIIWNVSTGLWQFGISADGTTTNTGHCDIIQTPTLDTWYFLCGRFDKAAGQMYFSINAGTPVQVAFAGPVFHSTAPLQLMAFGGLIRTNGTVDEVGMWNRFLSNTEVLQLYNYGNSGQSYPFP
jgi:hypothetical protein